jgi:hypothetical protein
MRCKGLRGVCATPPPLSLSVGHHEMIKTKIKLRLYFGLVFGIVSLVMSWLFLAESSPFYNYFLWHVWLKNQWIRLNLPAIVLGSIVSGNIHSPSIIATYAALFIQWFAFGYILSVIFIRK